MKGNCNSLCGECNYNTTMIFKFSSLSLSLSRSVVSVCLQSVCRFLFTLILTMPSHFSRKFCAIPLHCPPRHRRPPPRPPLGHCGSLSSSTERRPLPSWSRRRSSMETGSSGWLQIRGSHWHWTRDTDTWHVTWHECHLMTYRSSLCVAVVLVSRDIALLTTTGLLLTVRTSFLL